MGLKDIFMFILVVGIAVFIILWQRSKKEANANKKTAEIPQEENQVNIPVEKIPYIRKNLMTKNEWSFYKQLKPVADELNLSILCKTRVADLVDIEKGLNKSEWQTAFNRINKKHIDFILCKPENLYPILLIELDDSTHDTDKGKKRDEFVEKVLDKAGYKLFRTRGTANLKEQIEAEIKPKNEP